MAKQRTKLKDFFEGKRRECSLPDFHVHKNKAGVMSMKLSVSMPLSDRDPSGMPEQVSELYALMAKAKSTQNRSAVDVVIEGAEVSIFSTGSIKHPTVKATAGMLQKFVLVGNGVDEKRTVVLEFAMYLPLNDALKEWAFPVLHQTFFVEVFPAQMELVTDADPADPKPNRKKKPEEAGSTLLQ